MQTITLQPMLHRKTEQIALHFADRSLNLLVKQLPGIKWSQTNKCWYLPLSKENYTLLQNHVNEKVLLDASALKTWMLQKKQVEATLPEQTRQPQQLATNKAFNLCEANLQALAVFIQQLTLKAYSKSTINTYRNEFMQLLQLLGSKPAEQLTVPDLKRYMVFAMEQQGISENTAHSRLNAFTP